MNALKQFRIVSLAEGVSFLLLLGIGVPLKHVWGIPQGSRILGSLHGALTLFFLLTLFRTASELGWPKKRVVLAFVASLVPFGAFFFDRYLVKSELVGTDRPTSGA